MTVDPTGQTFGAAPGGASGAVSGAISGAASADHARCPYCAALVRPGAQWCTLCYADLRPKPVAPVAPVTPAEPGAAAATSSAPGIEPFDPLTAPLALLEHGGVAPETGDLATERQPTRGWPCARCGATVALDEASCTSCGAGFLDGAVSEDPLLNRLGGGPISNQVKLFIMVGGSLALLLLGVGLMYLLGSVL